MAGPSRIAAALDYLERLKAQADQASTQTQLQVAKVARDFAGGVGQSLANRARDLGQMGYEAFTSAPATPQTTAEFAELASQRQPTPMLDATAQGLGQFGKALVTDPVGTGRAMVSGELERARTASTSPEAAGEYAGSFIDPMRIAKALRAAPSVRELIVHHGTPHTFEPTEANPLGEFDASKIGTGEGAQAYGHGIYYAENPNVAQSYIAAGGSAVGIPQNYAADIVAMMGGEQKAIKHLKHIMPPKGEKTFSGESREFIEQTLRDVESGAYKTKQGSLYKADLPDEMIDKMLDWDKPLSEQPKVLEALLNADDEWKTYSSALSPKYKNLAKEMIIGAKPKYGDEGVDLFMQLQKHNPNIDHNLVYDISRKINPQVSDQDWLFSVLGGSGAAGSGIRGGGGADLYNSLGGGSKASEALRQLGIPGIKYLDSGSRGAEGTGTRNFVVFPGEEKKVKILERK